MPLYAQLLKILDANHFEMKRRIGIEEFDAIHPES